jgi:hypothetical protein
MVISTIIGIRMSALSGALPNDAIEIPTKRNEKPWKIQADIIPPPFSC